MSHAQSLSFPYLISSAHSTRIPIQNSSLFPSHGDKHCDHPRPEATFGQMAESNTLTWNRQHRIERIRTDDSNRPVSFMLETHIGVIDLLFLWRLSSIWWRNNTKDQGQIPSFDSPKSLCMCEALKKHGETHWQQDHWKAVNARRGAWKHDQDTVEIFWQQNEKYRNYQQVLGWTEAFCPYLDHLTTIDISGIRGTSTRAPSRFDSTMRIVKLDQWKQ